MGLGDRMGTGPALIPNARLQREVSLPMLVLYGLGTTVGAGIYALTGEVAGVAGMRAPLSFLVAAVLAGVTGLSFAELAGRLPRAAGEAVFVEHAFARRRVTSLVGAAVMLAGVVAAAAITNAFGGYLSDLIGVSRTTLVLGLVVVLTLVTISGAKESVLAAAVFTVIEIVGLLLVVWTARDVLPDAPGRAGDLLGLPTGLDDWSGVLAGGFLAFFAFLGFEDIDAVAEETEDAPVTLPRAIVITLGVTLILYLLVSAVAVLVVDPAELGRSDAPLTLVYERSGGRGELLGGIAGLAMVNGALVQLVMVPRVAYGLSQLAVLPPWIGVISPRTHTPIRATVIGAVVVAVLATTVDLGPLARVTSATTMAIFIAINAALIAIRRREGVSSTFHVPVWLPYVGITASAGMFAAEVARIAGWS